MFISREFFFQFHCGARLAGEDSVESEEEMRNLYNQFRSWKSMRRKRLMHKNMMMMMGKMTSWMTNRSYANA